MSQIKELLVNTQVLGKAKIPYILTPEQENEALDKEVKQIKYDKPALSEKYILETYVKKDAVLSRYNAILYHEKMFPIWDAEKIERLRTQKDELQKYWTRSRFYNLMVHNFKQNNIEFKYTEESESYKRYIAKLCSWMANDADKCKEFKIDLNKGLLVIGGYGVGKTKPIMMIKNNGLMKIDVYSLQMIYDALRESGSYRIAEGFESKIYFDDLGSEETPFNYFGTKINWWAQYVEVFYLSQRNPNRFIVTTNLTLEELDAKYGERIASRMVEMFNIIIISDKRNRRTEIKDKK